jgi:tRNA(fMet)-specific endonuclease VapC
LTAATSSPHEKLVPPETLLDTDILSLFLRAEPQVVARAKEYTEAHGRLMFSLITRYEILRGLNAKGATAQIAAFEAFCVGCTILPLTDAVVLRAAATYADLYQRGQLIGDADILIAATALENGLTLSTNNTAHFGRITSLVLTNWLTP